MRRERGFLLFDALASVLLIGLTAAALFPLVTASRRQAARASLDLAAAAAAEELITRRSLGTRSLANPQGQAAAAGEERSTITLGQRTFTATLTKEVVPSCIGLYRWRVSVAPAGEPGEVARGETVRFLAGCYDPY